MSLNEFSIKVEEGIGTNLPHLGTFHWVSHLIFPSSSQIKEQLEIETKKESVIGQINSDNVF